MTRIAVAATMSLALLSLAAVEAAAGPVKAPYNVTYTLQCATSKLFPGEKKYTFAVVTNTSGRVIPNGTKISIAYYPSIGFGRIRVVTETTYQNVNINKTIKSAILGTSPRCTAQVTLSRSLSLPLPLDAVKVVRR